MSVIDSILQKVFSSLVAAIQTRPLNATNKITSTSASIQPCFTYTFPTLLIPQQLSPMAVKSLVPMSALTNSSCTPLMFISPNSTTSLHRVHTCIQLCPRSNVTNSTCMLMMVVSLSQTCNSSVKAHSSIMMSLISSTSSNYYPLMIFSVLPAIIMIHPKSLLPCVLPTYPHPTFNAFFDTVAVLTAYDPAPCSLCLPHSIMIPSSNTPYTTAITNTP